MSSRSKILGSLLLLALLGGAYWKWRQPAPATQQTPPATPVAEEKQVELPASELQPLAEQTLIDTLPVSGNLKRSEEHTSELQSH